MDRYRDRMKQAILSAMDHAAIYGDEETALELAMVMSYIAAEERVSDQAARSLAVVGHSMRAPLQADLGRDGRYATIP